MIKNAEELSSLYDLSGLSLVDNDSDKVIITDVNKLYNENSDNTKFRKVLSELITKKLGKLNTGDIVLFADEDFSRKIYCVITVSCGKQVPYIIYDVNYETGSEWLNNFSQGDVEMLSEYPMFSDPSEITFFLCNLNRIFGNMASTPNKLLVQYVKNYLDKGIWAVITDGYFSNSSEIANALGLYKVATKVGEGDDVLYEKDGKYLAFLDYNLYGSYELVKAAYCEISKQKDSEDLIFTNTFGAMFFATHEGFVMQKLTEYEDILKRISKPAPVKKTEKEVSSEIIAAATSTPGEDFFAKAESMIELAKKDDKKKTKKKREAAFEIQAEVTEEEKQIAINETIMKPSVNITVPKNVRKQKILAAEKESEAIINSVTNSYPADWDYVYTVGETSRMYNPTIGQEFVNGKFVLNEKQVRGMSIEEWNAYFYAHPELSNLIEETIGHMGGLFLTEDELKESGHLLYNPRKLKLDYVHEYVVGNVYTLIEEFETVKDAVVQIYGQSFYDRQMEILLSKKPAVKSITAADEKNVPYIHPLDEVVIDYKINSAASITFYNNQNRGLMNAEKNRLESDVKAGVIKSDDVDIMIEEFGGKLQSLSITIFFMDWLGEQIGKLAAYGLPDIAMVNALYFYGMSYPMFASGMEQRGLIIVPQDKKAVDIVTYSDYYEAKDSAKRFVNDLFQDFLLSEISDQDRSTIEYEWNKRYNGYVTANVWKLPIFIRHSKYFKDRTSRRQLKLSESQITGIKFATIDNSSIMAHEVGYGKCNPLTSNILTPKGWVKMGDIKKGDLVISVDGNPTEVTNIYPQGKKDIYKVTFDDGSSAECCDEHLWTVIDTTKKSRGGDWITMPLKNMMDKDLLLSIKAKNTNQSYKFKTYYKEKVGDSLRNKWQIPVVSSVHFDKQELPLHPYLLGALLGDGSMALNAASFTTIDQEILTQCQRFAGPNVSIKLSGKSKKDYNISKSNGKKNGPNEIVSALKVLNLNGKKSNNKFIPDIYKFTSVEDRIWLLQGLMDTDGTVNKKNKAISYTTVSDRLRDDLIFLVRSLGGIATVYSRKPKYTYKGEKKIGQLAHTISINLPPNIIPFTLERKLAVHVPKTKYQPARFISNIEYVGKKEAQCISVAHPSHLYVMDDFIVTHNTLIAIGYMSHCFETNQASNFLLTVPKTLYVNRKWREEIYGYNDKARDRYIIGATPIYNIIELGNFSTSEIWGGGESKYKNYTEDEEKKINQLFQLFTEIGGKQAGGRTSKSQGTATIPKNPYNYRQAVVTSNYAWSKLVDKVLPNIDKHLFNRSISKGYEEHKEVIKYLAGFNLGTSAKDKLNNLSKLADKIIEIRWFYQVHLPIFGPDIEFKTAQDYDEKTLKDWYKFANKQLPEQFERNKEGKIIYESVDYFDKDGIKKTRDVPKPRPVKAVYEEFLMMVLEELHGWIEGVIQKMSDFAIYEYGTWKFDSSNQNIILSTKEALQNLGFSSNYLNGIVEVIKEITTYKSEVNNYDIDRSYVVKYVDENGEEQKFKRDPEKVLQKQLQEMINKIGQSMTEEGPRGKFFLENLKIDGFILDEAHVAKKLFTNVKTDASVRIDDEEGKVTLIKTTSHDIRGGTAPETSISVFGICQYIKSIGNKKPLMLLTATPFSNQPTEIFSMLALVGIKQLREYGISNIKNFFDLFLKETLKYDFNHSGEFIKRITVEDFRNKELLINLIWSVMDIRRESSLDKSDLEERQYGDKPIRKVFPKLVAESSMTQVQVEEEDEADYGLSECEQLGKVSTIAVVNKLSLNTCSIVDQNDVQKRMLGDIEKVVHGTVNPNTNLEYTFDDVCPNAAIFNEIEKEKGKASKTEEEEERDSVVVALRTILNTKVKKIPNGLNVADYGVAQRSIPDMKYGELVFVAEDTDGKWRIYKKIRTKSRTNAYDTLEMVTDEETIEETLKTLSKKTDYGVTFKALGMSRAIALSPYLFRCNDLPEPTPENIIKYSPKIEYLVKALKSVKDYHINEIPKKIKDREDELAVLNSLSKKTQDDIERISQIMKELPQLESARQVSGQVVYMNMIRFNYYSRSEKGKAMAQQFNLAELIKQYLIDKSWFTEEEVQIVSSNTKDSVKEQYIKDFQDGKIKVLFGTPAIKEGVDLQNKASTMYIMTPDWNPTDMRQVEGRIWRRDNENKFVRIVYVLLDQSVEVFIYAKLEEKARRLQQIMKERDTIAELEEMSLNPNETKVALASDPEKRADIVTKLCQAVLMDQRNKINKSREELNRVAGNIDTVYNNLEIIKNQYLVPYNEIIPDIDKRYYDFQMQSIIEQYMNAKKTFVNRFASDYYVQQVNGVYNKVNQDKTLSLALCLLGGVTPTIEQTLLWLTTSDMSAVQDILNGIELVLENEQKVLSESRKTNDGSLYISWDSINDLMPMKHSTENHWNLLSDYLIGTFRPHYQIRIFKLPTILTCYTEEMKARLLATIKDVKQGMAQGKMSRYDIRDRFENLTVLLMEDLYSYANQSPLVRPENYLPYAEAQRNRLNSKVNLTGDEFDAMELMTKIKKVQELYEELDKSIGTFKNADVNKKRSILNRTNKTPQKAEVLVDLGLAFEDKTLQQEALLQMEELFRPVLRIKSVLREIEESFLKARGLSIDDLPVLVNQYNAEYDVMTQKIQALEKSRQRLIERFRKTSEQRKLVTIDQIVARFAETNTYLDKKLYTGN